MSAQLIDGKGLAARLRQDVQKQVSARVAAGKRPPGLAVVLIGRDPASAIYVSHKIQACKSIGFVSNTHELPEETTQTELLALINRLNRDPSIDGILVQLPLPPHFVVEDIIEAIAPDKDVDGFHPYNMGRLAQRIPVLRPCTPKGIISILDHIGVDPTGLNATVVGASNIVGRPATLELLLRGATVTTAHRFTRDLPGVVGQADILVVAVGKPNIVKGEWVKDGSIVIDVGMNRLEDGTLCGDVAFETARQRAAWITPVPGGVGPMTVASLMENTLYAAEHLHDKE
jgi:methylenetetrahydrofolate dehydrogenase (NADP+)/methenyltetrahydrofolate cyclohydrolase